MIVNLSGLCGCRFHLSTLSKSFEDTVFELVVDENVYFAARIKITLILKTFGQISQLDRKISP